MHKEEPKINCSTFQKKEQIISDITNKINLAKEVQEKARFAQDLQREADELLSCQGYDNKKIDFSLDEVNFLRMALSFLMSHPLVFLL